MKTLKKIFKNILSVIIFLLTILWILPTSLLVAFIRFIEKPRFPRTFFKSLLSYKNDIKEYFGMELHEQLVSSMVLIIGFNIGNKWTLKKNNTI